MNLQQKESLRRSGRRKAIILLAQAATGFSVIALEACMPKKAKEYDVKVRYTQNQSRFMPPSLVIPKGSTVIWQNQSIYPQTITCDAEKSTAEAAMRLPEGAQPWDSGKLYPGQSWAYTFEVPGDYLYTSQFFEDPFQVGAITVKS